jgi:hypothetical protein
LTLVQTIYLIHQRILVGRVAGRGSP